MKKLKLIKRILSFVICCTLSTALIAGLPESFSTSKKASAKTLEEIAQEREANNQMIADLEVKIGSLEGDKAQEQQYQNVLGEQIGFIQSNIDLLNSELEQISANINTAEVNITVLDENIAGMEKTIKAQQAAIDKKVEVFKERLCAMYVSGNEQLSSILVGSASFYDMLSRVEMVNRIAANDEKLINDILDEISKMEQYKAELETEKQNLQLEKENLEASLAQQQASKEEKASEMVTLYDKMQHTQSEIARLSNEETLLTVNKDELSRINAELDKEEDSIKEEIRKAAEEAQRIFEEKQRQKAEEEARRKAEEEAKRKAEEERIAREKAAAEEAARIAAEKAAAEKAAAEEAARLAAEKKAAEERAAAEAAAAEAARKAEEAQRAAEEAAAEAQRQAEEEQARAEEQARQDQQAAAQQAVAGNVSSSGFMWPVPGFRYITSGVGPRWGRSHNGIDIGDAGIDGANIVASRAGTVHIGYLGCPHDYGKSGSCGCGGGYGNYVMIYHDGTYTTLYGHMKSISVSEGQYVEQGEVIGRVGSTGYSTGPHLHFEVRKNGSYDDPENYVSP